LAAFVAFLKLEPFDFESAEVVEKDDTWGGGGGCCQQKIWPEDKNTTGGTAFFAV